MFNRRLSARGAFRLSGLVGLVAGAMMVLTGAAGAAESYTFAGLRWGSSPDDVRKALETQGFTVRRVISGPQRELAENGAWGEWVKKDRGKRMVARGAVGGLATNVELVFGENDALERVIVRWPDWNGTMRHAKSLTVMATTITKQLETQYGRSNERRDPFGWVDTARWLPAGDGSRMELIIRGTNGMMFYPGDKTGVRLHFWNAKYGATGGAQTARRGQRSVPRFGPGRRSETQEIKQKPASGAPKNLFGEDR